MGDVITSESNKGKQGRMGREEELLTEALAPGFFCADELTFVSS